MANCLRQNFRHHSERCYPQCWKVPKILDSYRSYPAVLIGRLGVNHSFQGQGLNICEAVSLRHSLMLNLS